MKRLRTHTYIYIQHDVHVDFCYIEESTLDNSILHADSGTSMVIIHRKNISRIVLYTGTHEIDRFI